MRRSICSYRNHQRAIVKYLKPEYRKIPPIVNESPASESDSEAAKEKENLLEDDHYDIVIEKQISN